ncbi:hypothetical protein Hypma_004142 [Hypsizygus marmoreus]|uniref:F-box domain-containing protein n=1 Tax=Hypsizygus marmoreus TaxID=39966 RepID=A0A369J0M1_HYPMA|nr:hypothetical protein Hypma_004142 [Hypsizygus marmoreus]
MTKDVPTLATLDNDVLFTVFDALKYTLRYDRSVTSTTPCLLPLSSTCKRLRATIAPSIFQRLTNERGMWSECSDNDFWPSTIWKYIETVVVCGDTRSPRAMAHEVVASILPKLPSLKRFSFQMESAPPVVLLNAIAVIEIAALEFTNVRLDGPPLTDTFSRLRLTHLLLTASPWRLENLNSTAERKNVADILSTLSNTLVYLKVSGNFISFKTLARLDWPFLQTLTLIDRIPNEIVIPIPTVISQMPHLRNLHYNFGATSETYIPPIVYWPENHASASLAATHPCMQSLSLSNICPAEHIMDHLPHGLRSLRILALRERGQQSLLPPWYPFSPLRKEDALRIIARAALLPYLVDLALTLVDLPSPNVLDAVAKSCPKLRILEVSKGDFELEEGDSPYLIQHLIEPLAQLEDLRELRISIGFGSQYIGSPFRGLKDKTPLYRRMDAAGNMFAKMLPKLNFLSFSFGNDGHYSELPDHVIWYKYGIVNGVDGNPPVALLDIESGCEASSEPDDKTLCGFP